MLWLVGGFKKWPSCAESDHLDCPGFPESTQRQKLVTGLPRARPDPPLPVGEPADD